MYVKCSMIIGSNKRCEFCEGLYSTFRVYKKKIFGSKVQIYKANSYSNPQKEIL